jgi:hypothetical protein
MAKILLSPLGRSPGAVSGLYHALDEDGVAIDRLMVLATSDQAVQESAEALYSHFYDKPDGFLLVQEISAGNDTEMVGERAVYGFIHRVNAVLYNARIAGDEVHIGIAGGRKSMSALATLSAYVYGAAAVYHFWIHEEIERCGDIYALPNDTKKREWVMHPSKFRPAEFNEQGEHSHELVPIPLAPFHRLWDQDRLEEMLAQHPEARDALLRDVTDREIQELQQLETQLQETSLPLQQVKEMVKSTLSGTVGQKITVKVSGEKGAPPKWEVTVEGMTWQGLVGTEMVKAVISGLATFAGAVAVSLQAP